MKRDAQKVFSLAAVVVAAILFGMILSGGLDMTKRVDADRPEPVPAATAEWPGPARLRRPGRPCRAVGGVGVLGRGSEPVGRPPRDAERSLSLLLRSPRGCPNRQREPQVRRSSGSGFFITATGEIITNHHVIEDADKIRVRLVDDVEYQVEVVVNGSGDRHCAAAGGQARS